MMRIRRYIAGEGLLIIKVCEEAFPVRGIVHSPFEGGHRLRLDFRYCWSQLAACEAGSFRQKNNHISVVRPRCHIPSNENAPTDLTLRKVLGPGDQRVPFGVRDGSSCD